MTHEVFTGNDLLQSTQTLICYRVIYKQLRTPVRQHFWFTGKPSIRMNSCLILHVKHHTISHCHFRTGVVRTQRSRSLLLRTSNSQSSLFRSTLFAYHVGLPVYYLWFCWLATGAGEKRRKKWMRIRPRVTICELYWGDPVWIVLRWPCVNRTEVTLCESYWGDAVWIILRWPCVNRTEAVSYTHLRAHETA